MIFKIWFIFGVACAAALCRSKDASGGHFNHSKYKSLVALAFLCNFIHTIFTSFLFTILSISESVSSRGNSGSILTLFLLGNDCMSHTVCAIYYWRVSEIKPFLPVHMKLSHQRKSHLHKSVPCTQVQPTQIFK